MFSTIKAWNGNLTSLETQPSHAPHSYVVYLTDGIQPFSPNTDTCIEQEHLSLQQAKVSYSLWMHNHYFH